MYGMVNKSVQALVTTNFGIDKWEAIKKKAGVKEDVFLSNESYPDATTYGLIGAATEVLGLSADEILFAFGEFWVLHTAREEYGDMLSSAGRDLPEFLNTFQCSTFAWRLFFQTSSRRALNVPIGKRIESPCTTTATALACPFCSGSIQWRCKIV